ncbi:MAG: HU family DNA-binding protein [Arachidicoccus sp.]|nr:HU family DNA-binding protein [Arachidicoccus sp.]
MNKGELIDVLSDKAGTTKADAAKLLDAFTATVIETLGKGDDIALVGFGTFSVAERAARDGRNPQTGETIKIKASKVAKFKAGKALSEAVNTKAKKKAKK